MDEAKRCLNCKNKPCVQRLPGQHRHPRIYRKASPTRIWRALTRCMTASTSLPAVCGRVCPQETQCEGKCVRGIKGEPVGIGRLERFVADWHTRTCRATMPEAPAPNGHKVAVIGAGPSGLTCAGDLGEAGL